MRVLGKQSVVDAGKGVVRGEGERGRKIEVISQQHKVIF